MVMAGMLNDRYTNPRMIPKSMSLDLIGDGNRFSEMIIRKHK